MTDDELVAAIRASLVERAAPEPATEAAIIEAESVIGFPVPAILRRLYVEVANGGFGPRFGILGVRGHDHFTCDDYADITKAYWGGDPAFSGLVPVVEWGCALWSYCDFSSSDGEIWAWDPTHAAHDTAFSPPERPSGSGSPTQSPIPTVMTSTRASSTLPPWKGSAAQGRPDGDGTDAAQRTTSMQQVLLFTLLKTSSRMCRDHSVCISTTA